ncbi:MAG: hydrogenase expression/formation protein HypE [Dehalococcoidia bacterium]|nr:hydrogenase expression/formation protein HypE [Dehalococcoidia bacterium]
MENTMGDKILLAHGSGGKLTHDLVAKHFLPLFDNSFLRQLDDSAVLDLNGRLAFTTDSYVVNPIFFPGGDIGKLAVCGTVNDLSMSGARPMYLSLSLIIEEGLSMSDLNFIMRSARDAADEAGVKVVTGDTKVVDRGSADRLFINTAGLGVIRPGVDISGSNARPGDRVILSGPIGEHGIAVMSQREGLRFSSPVESDCAPLNGLVEAILDSGVEIRCLRDPTRGGLAGTLNEFASASKVGIRIDEKSIPVGEAVQGACELLGLDPLYVANEGKLVAVVDPGGAGRVLAAMRECRYGGGAVTIGEVIAEHPGRVVMSTLMGASRIIDMLVGEQLPRIC